jgi:hypothetical protein
MRTAKRLIALLATFIRLHLIAIGVIAVLVLSYTLAGFLLVPRIVRAQLTSYVIETLHRQVSIGEIRFNPYAFDASIAGLALREADGSPVVSFRHLYVNAELASLWQRAVVLREVQLAAPDIELKIAGDGSVNLAQLAPASEAAPVEETTPLPKVRIGRLEVRDGRIGFTDHTHEQPFSAAVAPIKFTLTDFKTDPNYANTYDFSGATVAGEQLRWAGDFTVQPLGSTGQFSVEGLKATTIDAYAAEMLPFQLASGQATLAGTYRFATTPTLGLEVALPLLQVRDLAMKERKATAAPIKLPEVDVHDISLSYEKRDLGVKRVDVKGAHVDVAREADGSISLMRLFGDATTEDAQPLTSSQPASEPASPDSQAPVSQDDGAQWRVHVDSVQLSEATVLAEDRSVTPAVKFELTPASLTVDGWSTDTSAKLQIATDVTINQKGRLNGKGELQFEPLSARLAVELVDFNLPVIQPYLAALTAMTLHSGQLGVKGDVSYAASPAAAPPFEFKGEVRVANLSTTDQLVNEDFIKWRSLAITGIDFSQNPGKLTIDRIVARQPYGKVVIAKDSSLNVTKVLSPPGTGEPAANDGGSAPAGESKDAAAASLPMRIKTVQLIDGSANFADYSIEPSFATGILELNGTVTGLSSNPASRAKVKLDGKVDRYAPVDIGGEVNLLSAAKYTDLAMSFRNMELTTFNPYSGKFAGYNISKGKLSTELKYLVQERKLDASHHIVIDNLEFGDKTDSKDAAPIPLKLAVALLKDRHGIMDLNLPVSGTLDDPKFRLGPIIWKAVLNLLTKIVTAPFAALGALFGGGEELAFVDFDAGSAALQPAQAEKLNKLASALIERPQLKLSVPLTVVTTQDREAMARAAFAQKLPPDTPAEPPTDDAGKRKRIALLEKIYKEVAQSAVAYPPETETKDGIDFDARLQFLERSLLERMVPDDAALTTLAQQRARAVQEALLANTELSPERVFITAERSEGKSEASLIRMELKLE